MPDHASCCAGGCGGCRSHVLLLNETELALLRELGALAFLPVCCTRTDETPVYLTDAGSRPAVSAALIAMQLKRLITIDFALPLQGFDYRAYDAYPIHGSMALTLEGQEALESLEIQGVRD